MDISHWRGQIDSLEGTLIEILNQRAQYAVEIGHIKREQNLPVFDPTREQQILDRIVGRNPGPLPPASIARIFLTIMEETRKLESSLHDNQ